MSTEVVLIPLLSVVLLIVAWARNKILNAKKGFVAGEHLSIGDLVYIGADGKIYAVTGDVGDYVGVVLQYGVNSIHASIAIKPTESKEGARDTEGKAE